MSYGLIKSLLFQCPPELAHSLALNALRYTPGGCFAPIPNHEYECMGLRFPNPVGLAAGLDKNGDYLDALAKLGFGFIEIGTTTPKPQPGNPKPRLFRLTESGALLNRMGFNNKGVDYLVHQVQKSRYRGILGINIGKNKHTPNEQAFDDYWTCLKKVYPHCCYVTINLSSPNTPGLRQLQQEAAFDALISQLKKAQLNLSEQYQQYKPMLVKVSPDESDATLATIAASVKKYEIDGVIATNTTLQRPGGIDEQCRGETGGLSGEPLNGLAVKTVAKLAEQFNGSVPIVGVGGIHDSRSARACLDAGASLIQVYSGLIYRGPNLVKTLVQEFKACDA